LCRAAYARDLDDPFAVSFFPFARRLRCQRQHRFEQSDSWIADGELCGVDADGQAASARIAVISRQSALASFVEPAIGVERERMRRNDNSVTQRPTNFLVNHPHQNFPSLTSNFVGLFKLLPPVSTQCATLSINSSIFTSGSPSNRRQSEALLSRASPDSCPLKTALRPKRRGENTGAPPTPKSSRRGHV